MIRGVLLIIAFLLTGTASLHLYRDTHYVLGARKSIPALLAHRDDGAAGVIMVMQPEDCLGSGELVARWNAIHNAAKFPVTALVIGTTHLSPRQQELFQQHHVSFPLRAIHARDAAAVAEKLGHTSTPFAVVLDREGRIAASFSATQNMPVEVLENLVAGRGGLPLASNPR
jgi:hypothetical protein